MSSQPTSNSKRTRVLIIDDERNLADSIARGLQEEGMHVVTTYDGKAGLDEASRGTYDVIICDVLLPNVNGYQVIRQLRARDIWTPVLALTAKDGEYDEIDLLEEGADRFLSKPASFARVLANVRALVRRGDGGRGHCLEVGDLVLDQEARECFRGDTAIELTGREFSLLESLARRSGSVVAKDQLLNEVWGPNFAGNQNVVEVYIGYLRKKIDTPFGRRTLRTVRGVGYMLTDDAT